MRLYHLSKSTLYRAIGLFCLLLALWGCAQPQSTQALISVSISADHEELSLKIPAGSTVQDVLKSAQLTLGELDSVDPPLQTVLTEGSRVKVTRVSEEFYVEQRIIPFEHQELRNEALPEGERRLSQPGATGLMEITYRRVFEDGIEVVDSEVKSVIVKEAVPEVVVIGSRSMFAAIAIPGKIAFLSAWNAWTIENSTGNRRLVVSTGDLDGRVFSLSHDGRYLLFTRFSSSTGEINSLWAAALESDPVKIIDLGGRNIVHFAEFNPDGSSVAYSTSDWREASPGWQANNDLFEVAISSSGVVGAPRQDLPAGSGGIYGWWGTDYSWSPNGKQLIYSRPDGIGIFDKEENTRTSILEITPYQTGSDWAWMPGVTWSPAGNVVYAVSRVISETASIPRTDEFNLVAIPLQGGSPVTLVKNVGMFAYPVASPAQTKSLLIDPVAAEDSAQADFSIAYLQALFPEQSDTSLYRLFSIDRDGSDQNALFPKDGASGLAPQRVAWSPSTLGEQGSYAVAVVYNGNLWLVDSITGAAQQVTGDGLTTRVDWR